MQYFIFSYVFFKQKENFKLKISFKLTCCMLTFITTFPSRTWHLRFVSPSTRWLNLRHMACLAVPHDERFLQDVTWSERWKSILLLTNFSTRNVSQSQIWIIKKVRMFTTGFDSIDHVRDRFFTCTTRKICKSVFRWEERLTDFGQLCSSLPKTCWSCSTATEMYQVMHVQSSWRG